ncbi:hypothetical protein N8D56_09635 [Devosia sp. A8/3-2]|nr:hypothetical protein N8D56_09635 [Devosia sp. A8/3-2]
MPVPSMSSCGGSPPAEQRAKRDALHGLLFAPEHRLRDLGITHEQLIQMLETQHR